MHFKEGVLQFDVLLVEGDPVVLNLLAHLLEMGNHRVRSASDANQAIQMILQQCPDVLITDLHVPGLGGLELCRQVRHLYSRKILPHYSYILLLAAQYGRKEIIEGLEAGVDDFIEKNVSSLAHFRAEIQARLNAAQRIRRLEHDLEFAAKYDSLTQLLNRIAFFEAGQVQWDRSIRNRIPLSVVMMDCDFFKRINDIYGHSVGDTTLREFANILRSCSRNTDIICRYGGEEFCAILPGCPEKEAWDWAERIRSQCELTLIRHTDLELSITVSFGIAERTETTGLLDHLIDRADQSLLAAKEWGRNRSVSYSELLEEIRSDSGLFAIELFDGATAKDVMVPFPLSIKPQDSPASVADHFLSSRLETLPITDPDGKFVGVVSETDLIGMIGQIERWTAPIKHSIFPNVASYPAETSIRKIVNFLSRTSARWVMIVHDGKLAGYINRSVLLRWLRNHWAVHSGLQDDIMPAIPSDNTIENNLGQAIDALKKELECVSSDCPEITKQDRLRLIAALSRCQGMMNDFMLCGLPTVCKEPTACKEKEER